MHPLKQKIIDGILATEGRFVNDPRDSGGPTKFGVTKAVAELFGYHGAIEDLPRSLAIEIYSTHYWIDVHADDLLLISAKVTEEIVDTGVNIGPTRTAKLFQRVLNVLNINGSLYSDLEVDGHIGPLTVSAFETCFRKRGEGVILLALNCLQGAHYISLAETYPKNERFVFGWLTKRVLL